MIDLHTHSLFSDGMLLPSELFRRAESKGYLALAVTDHVDASNIEQVISGVSLACRDWNESGSPLKVVPGVELTHVPPMHIEKLVNKARELGAKIVVVHGETVVEPVVAGTNEAAIKSGADVLAHPGLITMELAKEAAKNGVLLEITTRKGHSLTNGHVAKVGQHAGAQLVLNNDAHMPEDLVSPDFALRVVLGAGLTAADFDRMQKSAFTLFNKRL